MDLLAPPWLTFIISSMESLGAENLSVIPLGAGNEVGRSCILLQFKGKTIMLDCGVHPAYTGLASLPYFDEVDPSTVDLVLITHFHLDHAAALPYFMERTTFKGKVYMTHPTKAIYKWLLSDFVKVTNVASSFADGESEQLYTDEELYRSYDRIHTIDYHQQVDVNGVKFTAFNAGHVLGAAMFLIEIAGVRVLYTGDYSREEDRHLMAAETPPVRPEVLICESTYGVSSHMPRNERERRFTSLVHGIVARGGRCLIPIFALGRAQELLLILDEYWQAHKELHSIPVYYASSLAKKCLAVYQTYVNMMNERIKKQIAVNNPFIFKYVSNLKSTKHFDDSGPCVMMASPAMLQSGFSRELFEMWCPSPKNGLIIPGYVVEGTLAKALLSEPKEITSLNGEQLPVRLAIEYISFSAHVDFGQNSEFIDILHPSNVVLVHGEYSEMMRLKNALVSKYEHSEHPIVIHTPRNCESVNLQFRGEKQVKIVGELAQRIKTQKDASTLDAILVGKDYEYQLMNADDLVELTELKSVSFRQKQYVAAQVSISLIEYHLINLFGKARVSRNNDAITISSCSSEEEYVLKLTEPGMFCVEWNGSPLTDIVAESVISLVLSAEYSRASVKASSGGGEHAEDAHNHNHEAHQHIPPPSLVLQTIQKYLVDRFGNVEETTVDDNDDTPCYGFNHNGHSAKITMEDFRVICDDEATFTAINESVKCIRDLVNPDFII